MKRALTRAGPVVAVMIAIASAVAGAQERPSLEGRWEGSIPGGPAGGATRQVTFRGDRYEMTGYPSIGETARFRVLSRDAQSVRVRFEQRRTCGPCSTGAPQDAAPDRDVAIDVSADGGTITYDGFTLARQPAPRPPG